MTRANGSVRFEAAEMAQAAEVVRTRAGWGGRGRRVTASSLLEVFPGWTLWDARDLMRATASAGLGVSLVLSKGRSWTGALLVLDEVR